LKLDSKVNIKELFDKNFLINTSGKDIKVSIKNFVYLKNLQKETQI